MTIMDLARIIRSKNAGPFTFTMDIMFTTFEDYKKVKDSGIINRDTISVLYHVDKDKISIYESDNANGIKVSIPRTIPSGNLGDADVYGAQQQAPLLYLEVPD